MPLLGSGALPPSVVINVNAPAGAVARRPRGAARAPALPSRGCGRPARPRATGATTASTATVLRLDGEPGTDIAAVAEGYISLTPLRFDLFAEDALAALGALLPDAG